MQLVAWTSVSTASCLASACSCNWGLAALSVVAITLWKEAYNKNTREA
jgi:hypothetical protein